MFSLPLFPAETRILRFYGEAGRDHMGRAVAAVDVIGTGSLPDIILSGVAWTPPGAVMGVDPTEVGKGYIWNGSTVFVPPP